MLMDVGDGSWLGRELAEDTTVDIPEDTPVDEADTWDGVGCVVKGDRLIAALPLLPTKSIFHRSILDFLDSSGQPNMPSSV